MRSLARSVVISERCLASCVATPRFATGVAGIGRRSRKGSLIWLRGGRRSRGWSRTPGCSPTFRSVLPGRSAAGTACSSRGRSRRRSPEATNRIGRVGRGRWRGARSRSRTGSRSTFRMMGAYASVTRRSTSRSIFRGALKRELVWCLGTGRAVWVPWERSRRKMWAHVTPETLIREWLVEAEDRAVPGHGGDLRIGLERSALGTVVERRTGLTLLVHVPREEGYRHKETPKKGPVLVGYGAVTMKNAVAWASGQPSSTINLAIRRRWMGVRAALR